MGMIFQPPQAGNLARALGDAARGTALGLKVAVEGGPISGAEDITRAELAEYALVMIGTLQDTVIALAAQVDLLAAKIVELDN